MAHINSLYRNFGGTIANLSFTPSDTYNEQTFTDAINAVTSKIYQKLFNKQPPASKVSRDKTLAVLRKSFSTIRTFVKEMPDSQEKDKAINLLDEIKELGHEVSYQ